MSTLNSGPQINIKLEKTDFDLIAKAAADQHSPLVPFCRELILNAIHASHQDPNDLTPIADLIADLAATTDLARQDTAKTLAELTAQTTSAATTLLATLQEVLAVRTIVDNIALATYPGEGHIDELRNLADTSKTEYTTSVLAALERRLASTSTPNPSPDVDPEKNTHNV